MLMPVKLKKKRASSRFDFNGLKTLIWTVTMFTTLYHCVREVTVSAGIPLKDVVMMGG